MESQAQNKLTSRMDLVLFSISFIFCSASGIAIAFKYKQVNTFQAEVAEPG
jgi:hypothetical protein